MTASMKTTVSTTRSTATASRRGESGGRGRKQLADEQREHVPLSPGKRIGGFVLQVGGNIVIKRKFRLGAFKFRRDGKAFRVPDVFENILAERATAELLEAFSQFGDVAADVRVAGTKARQIAEKLRIDELRDAVKLRKIVLKRRRRKQDFAAAFERPKQRLADAVAFTVGVAELVAFVHHDRIPRNDFKIFAHLCREVIGHNENARELKRIRDARAPQLADTAGIQNLRRKIEFFLQLALPLLAERRRANHEKAASALRPKLTQHEPGFNGLAETDFVREEHAFRKRRLQREQRGLHLMRIQIHARVQERLANPVHVLSAAQRQRVREILRVISRSRGNY